MTQVSTSKIQEAITIFGREVVNEVVEMVESIGEADGVYSTYQDMGMDDQAECLAFIYFES